MGCFKKSVQRILNEKNLKNEALNECESNFTGFIEPNIGLLYVASAFKKANYEIKYIDLHLLDATIRTNYSRTITEDDIRKAIKDIPVDELNIVGISCLTVNYGWAIKISNIIKEIKKTCKVVLGGIHPSFEYKNILECEKNIDFICVGEGEETMVEVVDTFYGDRFISKELRNIKGLAYYEEGKIIFTGEREFINDLDNLAYPLYEVLPNEYFQNFVIRVITSRGCSNRCSFCVPSAFFNKLR